MSDTTSAPRAVLADDERLMREQLRSRIAEVWPELQIVAEAKNGLEAVELVKEHKPDLVFLDIQMPKLDGFEVVELAGSKPHYIFATAYDQFALRAFEVHAIDYLLKPFSRERLAQALAHARARTQQPAQVQALVAEAGQRHAPLERILIRDGARVHVVPAASVDYVEAQDDYVEVHAAGKSYLKNQRLSELESQLDPKAFVRIHRSYIVNVGAVVRIEPVSKDNHCAVLTSEVRLPISRSAYQKVRELLG